MVKGVGLESRGSSSETSQIFEPPWLTHQCLMRMYSRFKSRVRYGSTLGHKSSFRSKGFYSRFRSRVREHARARKIERDRGSEGGREGGRKREREGGRERETSRQPCQNPCSRSFLARGTRGCRRGSRR
jgi:hypothetical protein